MHARALPTWTMLPFVVLVLSIAALPLIVPHAWEKRRFQAAIVAVCTAPVVAFLLASGREGELLGTAASYATFTCTLGALFVSAGSVHVTCDFEATPRNNLLFLVGGSILASVIGTMGASVLLIRPLLRTNSQRERTGHLVPFFILTVANAGGLLTPLGDPPLLVGFIEGVPFLWTLRLWPVWLLYVGVCTLTFYVVDTRAFARETEVARALERRQTAPLTLRGAVNLGWLVAIAAAAAFLPRFLREGAMLGIGAASYFGTAREVRALNEFSFTPIVEVALLFAGLFVCLVPVEAALPGAATSLPLRQGWQLFWASGSLSAILDNAPTYAAFSALARGLSAGRTDLVAGIAPPLLTALSAGCVVMGATTYIGNGPNLVVKAIAERSGYQMPSFARFAAFAFVTMLPAHLVMTAVLAAM